MTTRATRSPRRRTVFALAVILAVLGAFVVRLVDIQVVSADQHVEDSKDLGGLSTTETIAGARGTIVDSEGGVLASSTIVYDAQLSPKLIAESEAKAETETQEDDSSTLSWAEASTKIAEIIGQSADELRAAVAEKLQADPESQYLHLANGLTTQQHLELRDLGLDYYYGEPREVRVYPNGAVAGNLVGYLDAAGAQSGVELIEDSCLSPSDGERSYKRGANGVVIPGSEETVDAVDGGTVQLTINSDLQWYLTQMIQEEAQYQGASAGTVTVVEVGTGKIRAAAEYPAMDPNNLDGTDAKNWGSRIFQAQFEPGSTFKALTAAAILDAGAVDLNTTVSAASQESFPNSGVIGDAVAHPQYNYTLAGALIDSSNVALSKFGTMIDSQTRYDYLRKFGVAETTIGFPGELSGILHPVEDWDARTHYTTTFGQGLTVTAPQVAGAYQAIANGGEKIDLSLIESCTKPDGTVIEAEEPEHTQVVSEDTANTVVRMLENVQVQGQLTEATNIDGYRLAIKTGTAQTSGVNGYKDGLYDTSMVGFAPAEDPQYVVIVTLKEPTRITSSTATASAFQKAMTQVLKTYRVAPSTVPMDELLPKFR